MRVRTSHSPDGWRDMGPCPEVQTKRGRNDAWFAAPIPEMLPLFGGAVPYSSGHTEPKPRSERVEPPMCGLMMKLAKTYCAMPAGHKDTHRSYSAVMARAERFAVRGRAA